MPGKEILIIDDDADLRVLLKKILVNAGMNVFEADTVEYALQLASQHAPHLIITDLNMPDQDGFVFLEKRRESVILRSVPVIVLSALKNKRTIYKAISLGANDYIAKPFTSALLLQKIRKIFKDKKFISVTYPPNKRPTITAMTRGMITRASEVGFLFESSIKVAPETRIFIRSKLLTDLRIDQCVFRSATRIAPMGGSGQYLNRVVVMGMSEAIARHIRKIVMRWK